MKSSQPCPCGKSKRGYTSYDDGSGYCFSGTCESPYFPPTEKKFMEQKKIEKSLPILGIYEWESKFDKPWRNIPVDVLNKYNIRMVLDPFILRTGKALTGSFVALPTYNLNNELVYEEYLQISEDKNSRLRASNGSKQGEDICLYGSYAFPYRQLKNSKYVTIVEGKADAPSAHTMLGDRSVVYSIGSAGEAKADLSRAYDYLTNNFERIYLCFDNDAAGEEATKVALSILPLHKTYVFPHASKEDELKDANDYLVKGKQEEFVKRWWKSSQPKIDGIVSSPDEYKEWLTEVPINKFEYPFPTLQEKLYGVRGNELILITADTGVGKTSLLREFEFKCFTDTKENIGLLHFEDSHQMKIYGLMNLYANKRLHLPISQPSQQEVDEAFNATFGSGRLISLDNFGTYQPDLLRNRIEYLIKVYDCKNIFLDHITITVAGAENERITLDELSTQLRSLCDSYGITLFVISHTNDAGRTRSSRALEQLCDVHLHLTRDLTSEEQKELNKTKITIKKSRFSGQTGFGGNLEFDNYSGRMNEI